MVLSIKSFSGGKISGINALLSNIECQRSSHVSLLLVKQKNEIFYLDCCLHQTFQWCSLSNLLFRYCCNKEYYRLRLGWTKPLSQLESLLTYSNIKFSWNKVLGWWCWPNWRRLLQWTDLLQWQQSNGGWILHCPIN